jgi:hypothetical protein
MTVDLLGGKGCPQRRLWADDQRLLVLPGQSMIIRSRLARRTQQFSPLPASAVYRSPRSDD